MNSANVLLFLAAACLFGAIVAFVAIRFERRRVRAAIHARLNALIATHVKPAKQ